MDIGTSNGSSFQKLLNYSTQKKNKLLDYATQKKKKFLDYVRKHRQKPLVDDKPVLPPPPKGQASTDVPEEPLPPPTDVPEEPLPPRTDVPEICLEPPPPDLFSEWVNNMDAAANKVDIHSEEADWKQQYSTDQLISFTSSHNLQIDAIAPQVISFGPFHHGAEHLNENEVHKRRALAHFLHRAEMQSEPFISKLKGILKQLQDSYQGLDKKWKENPYEFLKMMLLDGCLMIEVLRANESSYAPNDPVFSSQKRTLYKPYIKRDILSLENQFPLLVLKALLEVENCGPTDDEYINNLVLSYCSDYLRGSIPISPASQPLMLYHMSWVGKETNHMIVRIKTPTITMPKVMENVVKLKDNGVHFKKSQSTSLRDIKMDTKTGWLELPVFPVDDETEHLLLNLIAYEKYNVGVGNVIMSYIKFLYELINTEDDVKQLKKSGIMSNSLRSKDNIADLFNNSLGKSVVVDPSNDSLSILRSMLSDYMDYYSKKQKGNLLLRHPWKVLSVVTVTFVLTFVQTIYSALTFHLRK